MKTTVNKILDFCKTVQESTGEENPEIDYNEVMKALFPFQWKLDRYYDRTRRYDEDDDPDCYCE